MINVIDHKGLIYRKQSIRVSITSIVAFLFALRAVTFVWLAFATDMYMPIYADIVLFIRYSTAAIGPLYVFFFSKTIERKIQEAIAISSFLLFDKSEKIKVFRLFYYIILVCNVISLFLYILYLLRVPIFKVVFFYNDGIHSSYYNKWFIFAVLGDWLYTLPRLCGLFNEPGALGTVCGLLFAATFRYSSRIEKIILIVTAICTLSMAGFLLIIITYVIFLWGKSKKSTILVMLLLVFYLCIPYINWGNELLNSFAQRFVITSTGFAGDDRINDTFKTIYNEFLKTNNVFFGMGATYSSETGSSSYKSLILQFGFLGFGLFFALWLASVLLASKKNRNCLALVAVFIISLYQRPVTVTNSYGYMMLFGAIEWLHLMNESTKPIV